MKTQKNWLPKLRLKLEKIKFTKRKEALATVAPFSCKTYKNIIWKYFLKKQLIGTEMIPKIKHYRDFVNVQEHILESKDCVR